MKLPLVIVGAGGFGRVVADAARESTEYNLLGFLDDNQPTGTVVLGDLKVLSNWADAHKVIPPTARFVVAIGKNEPRAQIFTSLRERFSPGVVIHPSGIVSRYAQIGLGTIVLANSVVNVNCSVGENCIIDSMSLVDHDTKIGSHSYVAPGSVIGSNCQIPEYFFGQIRGNNI